MANHKGSEGKVKVSANTVAEVRDWSLDQTAETIDDTTMGDAARTRKPSLTSATGTVNCFWDETDTSGQVALSAGSEITMNLYPEGDTSGDTYYSLSAIVTSVSISGSFDGMVEAAISFESNGAVTTSTVV